MYYNLISSMNKASAIPSIVTSGLLTHLDAGNVASYSGSGTTWTDLSGNSRNGTLVNGVGYSSSNGGTLVFDGVNDYVSVNSISRSVMGSNFTVSLWFFSGTSNHKGIIELAATNNDLAPSILLQKNGSIIRFLFNGAYNFSSAISANTWYNIVLTYDNTTWKSYLNGVLANSAALAYIGGTFADKINIGSGYPNFFDSKIPQVAIYNRPISSTEVTTNFNALKSRYGY